MGNELLPIFEKSENPKHKITVFKPIDLLIAMVLILNFSRYMAVALLCEWLDVKDLCLFDSAVCNTSLRPILMCSVGLENVKFNGLFDTGAIDSYLAWLARRQLFVKQLNIKRRLPQKVQANCIACLSHLKILNITDDQGTISRDASSFCLIVPSWLSCGSLAALCSTTSWSCISATAAQSFK